MAAFVFFPHHPAETPEPWSISLHSTEGGADKIYDISIEPDGDLWVVNYANGRRGGTMATGTKTQKPLPYAAARLTAAKLCNEKTAKGYNPISGSRISSDAAAQGIRVGSKEDSGFRPQLLNPIDPYDLEDMLGNVTHIMQIKHDGERRLLIIKDHQATGVNRKGQVIGLSRVIADAAAAIGPNMVLDGEDLGDTLVVWDILELEGRDLKPLPYRDRIRILASQQIARAGATSVVESHFEPAEKRRIYKAAKAAGAEGVVFKDASAPYTSGRPNSGGDWQKFKFYNALSAIVSHVNDRRSVGLYLLDAAGARTEIGNVTIPSNFAIPREGEVVEVRYLYAFARGALNQPNYLGARPDISPAECLESQRVYDGVFDYDAGEVADHA